MDKTVKERMRRYRNKKRNETVTLCNAVTKRDVTVDVKTAARLLLICKSCDKEVQGLDGKVNLLTMIRYGGPTLESIKGQLDG